MIALAFLAWRVERDADATVGNKFLRIFGMASLLVPMFMTSAHENHLFLGSVFLVLFFAIDRRLSVRMAIQILLAIQFLNLNGLYAEHPARLAAFLRRIHSEQAVVAYSVVSLLCCVTIFACQISRRPKSE